MGIVEILYRELMRRDVSVYQFSKETGIPSPRVYKWIAGNGNPKAEDTDIIKQWLEKLVEEVPHESPAVKENEQTFQQKRNAKKNTEAPFLVPFMPVKAQAGYVRAIDQQLFIDSLESYAIPPGVDYRGAFWRYWEVEGDSMEPTFHSHDIILTSQVHRMDWEQLRNFYLYVIVTAERVLFKRIYTKNELEWVLISENEDNYPQQLIPAESVKEVWVYRRSIVNKAPPIKMFEIKV